MESNTEMGGSRVMYIGKKGNTLRGLGGEGEQLKDLGVDGSHRNKSG
jgi:hypothetical protein